MKIIKTTGNAKLIFLIVAFKLPILCGNAQPVVKDLIPETNIVYYSFITITEALNPVARFH